MGRKSISPRHPCGRTKGESTEEEEKEDLTAENAKFAKKRREF